MQVPALVEAGDERVADVLGVQPPRARCDRRSAAMRPIGMMLVAPSESQSPVPASATCITCLREVARRVVHVLVRGRDVAGGGVVVGAEVRGDDAAARPRAMSRGSATLPSAREDRLRRLDHQLEPQRAGRQLAPVLEGVARRRPAPRPARAP